MDQFSYNSDKLILELNIALAQIQEKYPELPTFYKVSLLLGSKNVFFYCPDNDIFLGEKLAPNSNSYYTAKVTRLELHRFIDQLLHHYDLLTLETCTVEFRNLVVETLKIHAPPAKVSEQYELPLEDNEE